VLVRIVRAVAEVDNGAGEELAGTVEGAPGEARFVGGLDDAGRLDGFSGDSEELEEPAGAELDLRWGGRRLNVLGVAKGWDGTILALEDHGEGRWPATEVGLDDFEAAHLVEDGWELGLGRMRRGSLRAGGQEGRGGSRAGATGSGPGWREEGDGGRFAGKAQGQDGASGSGEVGGAAEVVDADL
jgi:hypothetical protein